MTDLDSTQPGPAGLFWQTSNLTAAAWQQEHRARASLERWCSQCGQRAVYGYGETLTKEGILACEDGDCRASAKAAADARDAVKPVGEPAVSDDLFGRAA